MSLSIDDILHPGESSRRESAQFSAQIRTLDQMIHALSALDSASRQAIDSALAARHKISPQPAAQDSPPMAMGSEKGSSNPQQDCSCGISQTTKAPGQRGSHSCGQSVAQATTPVEYPEQVTTDGEQAGRFPCITHADGTAPRTGVNLIRLTDGSCVQCVVVYVERDQYVASEMDYDEGSPTCMRETPLAALEDLREILDDRRHGSVERVRDAEFARVVARARA